MQWPTLAGYGSAEHLSQSANVLSAIEGSQGEAGFELLAVVAQPDPGDDRGRGGVDLADAASAADPSTDRSDQVVVVIEDLIDVGDRLPFGNQRLGRLDLLALTIEFCVLAFDGLKGQIRGATTISNEALVLVQQLVSEDLQIG